jgi:hypothetical protein
VGSRHGPAPTDDELEALAPSTFAGSWLGEGRLHAEGRLHVAYTEDAERHAREAQERLGLSRKIVVVQHRHTVKELARISEEIVDARDELLQAGARLYAVGPDVKEDVVDVMVEPLTAAAVALLKERYGDAVHLEEGRVEPA